MEEYQVYRINPEKDKYYVTAEYTNKIGQYPKETYFTNIKPIYVGKYFKEISTGFGDGKQTIYYFYNDISHLVNKVWLSYEGTTCFAEVDSVEILNNRNRILSLATMMISDSEPYNNLHDQQNILQIVNLYLNKIYITKIKSILND